MLTAEPRPAATIILVRGGPKHGDDGLEALMVRRNPGSRFMPGAWVFPGGAVTAEDRGAATTAGDADEEAHVACGRRELMEEAGIELTDEVQLHPWSRWITPEVVPVRFDTRFYLAAAPPHATPRPDGGEVVDAQWLEPAEALRRGEAADFDLPFPTVKHLEDLMGLSSVGEAVEAAGSRQVEPILPKVVGTVEDFRVVLPGDPEY